MNLAQELVERGFVHQISGPSLEEIVDGKKRTIYHGIDPSADSAHVGNLVIWMLLRYLGQSGHKIVFLFGGGTGMIGDPKPEAERELKDQALVAQNVEALKVQAERFFAGSDILFVDNKEWLGELKLIDFLRDIGKHYTVNELIKKDAIATRLSSDTGLSYTEFAYPLLQGYDYLQLFETEGCTVQVGGSDQWGNIVSGVELVRRKKQTEVYAITTPLIIDKTTGKKFGKSEGNAVWLDPEKTSPYQFYQFWLNVSDESVVEYLKRFTFLSLEEISEIERDHETNPGDRLAQKKLAEEVTATVHGQTTMSLVQEVSDILFADIPVEDISNSGKDLLLGLPSEIAPKHVLGDQKKPLIDILVEVNLASSRREARTFIESGAISLNKEKVVDVEKEVEGSDFISGIALLRRGKKQYCILVIGQ